MKYDLNESLDKKLYKYNKEFNKNLDDIITKKKEELPTIQPIVPKTDVVYAKNEEDKVKQKIVTERYKARALATGERVKEEQKLEKEAEKKANDSGNFIVKTLDAINAPFDAILGGIEGLFAYNDDNFDGNPLDRLLEGVKAG